MYSQILITVFFRLNRYLNPSMSLGIHLLAIILLMPNNVSAVDLTEVEQIANSGAVDLSIRILE